MALSPVTGTVVPALAEHGLAVHYDEDARHYVVSRDATELVFVRRVTPSRRVYDSAYAVRHVDDSVFSLETHVDGCLVVAVVPVVVARIRHHDERAAEMARSADELSAKMAAAGCTDVLDYLLRNLI